MRNDILKCATCGLERDTVCHQFARDPTNAAIKWIKRRCAERRGALPRKCEIRLKWALELGAAAE